MRETKLTSNGLKNSLKNYSISDSVFEYVWNGFDAQATKVEIKEEKNDLGATCCITIKDDGIGINRNQLDEKFEKAYESEKTTRVKQGNTLIKGKKGVGRYSFYNSCTMAQWETVYQDNDTRKKYTITINASNLIKFDVSDETITDEPTGTTVKLILNQGLVVEDLSESLKLSCAWLIKLYEDKRTIYVNDKVLDCSDLIYSSETREKAFPNFKVKATIYVWKRKLHDEYSKYYYINSKQNVLCKENTTLNNKGDNFYHSIYIVSDLFDSNFCFETDMDDDNLIGCKTKKSKDFKELKGFCDSFLYETRKPFIKTYSQGYIKKLKSKDLYPAFDKSNAIDVFKEEQLDNLIANVYYFVPKVFTSLTLLQQKTLIRMFDLIQSAGETNNLFKILDGIVDLSKEERAEMADMLEKAELSNILEMLNLVVSRLQAINDFEALVFDKERDAKEVAHIQKFIEHHYWFFGEQYHLATAEEPNFEEALRTYLNYASDNYYKKGEVKIDDPNKYKQMDIFAIQSVKTGEIKKCIVVELKRPSVTLSSKELQQIKKYYSVIKNEPRFQSDKIAWDFILVGNKYNDEIQGEIENCRQHGIYNCVYKVDKCTIVVKTWSDIITELRMNMQYLEDKLKLDYTKLYDKSTYTSDQIILDQNGSKASMPKAIAEG
ncbi:MAG: ATP-binding protein [Clostridiales bacterium]|nr:ATP-binding protein [Clostridiales bacterium]